MKKLANGFWFKLISLCIINSFLLLDITWAGEPELFVIKPIGMLSAPVQISQEQFAVGFNAFYTDKTSAIHKPEIISAEHKQTKWSFKSICIAFLQSEHLGLLAQAYRMMKRCEERYDFYDDFKSVIVPLILIPGIIALSYSLGWAGDGIKETIYFLYLRYQENGFIEQAAYMVTGIVVLIVALSVGLTIIMGYLRLTWKVFKGAIFNVLKFGESLSFKILIKQKTGISKLKLSDEQIKQAKKIQIKYGDFDAKIINGLLFIYPPVKQNDPEQTALSVPDSSYVQPEIIQDDLVGSYYAVSADGQKFSIDELVSGLLIMQAI